MSQAPKHPNLWPSFEATFLEQLPVDPDDSGRRRQVTGAVASRVQPSAVPAPQLRAWSPEVAALLGLPGPLEEAAPLAPVLGGNALAPGMQPYAACYGGHQFGGWAGQLGDGRAITLGEVVQQGRRWELQLKGAGPTPYSRRGDGRAVLRSSIREFLCSEAMHHLGVPTTRALSLVTTGQQVVRDMFYDGHARPEPGAVVCRVAPSFVRFGNFEIFTSRGDQDTLRRLADYVLRTHFPQLGPPGPEAWLAWLREVCRRSAVMIAHWMRVGFVHGVMNTDNMSILGLTIDYGPYGWIDDYDPDWTPNTTDAAGRRYRFGHQPRVGAWNLERLAIALEPLIPDHAALNEALDLYVETLEEATWESFRGKLGLLTLGGPGDPEDSDSDLWLVEEVQRILCQAPTDMTRFYRALSQVPVQASASAQERLAPLQGAYYEPARVDADLQARTARWLDKLAARVRAQGEPAQARQARMHQANPKYVLRNYLAQQAIEAAEQGDFSQVHALARCMRRPYDEQPDMEPFAALRPDWAKHKPGCSMLSCSS